MQFFRSIRRPAYLPPLPEIHPIRRIFRVFRAAVVGFSRNGTGDQASALAFMSLVSLVPLAAAFSVLLSTFFGGDQGLAEAIGRALPTPSLRLTERLRSLVEHSRAVSGIGTLLFFVVAFRAYVRIETSVNRVWHIRSQRRFRTRIGAFLVMMFWGPVVLGILFNLRLALYSGAAFAGVRRLDDFGPGAAFLATTLAFTMIHWKGPNARVRFVPALVGGFAAAVGTFVIRVALARPWRLLKDVDVVYGSLGILVLFLVGLQAFWTWFLFTVEIAHAWQRSGRIPERHFAVLPPLEEDGTLAIRVACAVATGFRTGDTQFDADQWSDYLDVPADDVGRVVVRLVQARILEVDSSTGGLRPRRDPTRISLAEVWSAIEPPRSLEGPGSEALKGVDKARNALFGARNLYGEPFQSESVEGQEAAPRSEA